ncbi:MAG: hypothetical protein NC347_08960 [Clostridium sp.]|nr:hypothetical protein [Clostridium sp.]
MTNDELYLLTQKAVKEHEIVDLLQGKGIYQCPPNKYLPAYIPTDFERVLHQGIYLYYTNTRDETVVNGLEAAIQSLCHGDVVQIWIAYTYHWFLVYSKIGNKLPFKYHDREVGNVIATAILSHEKELKICKEWNGWNEPDGLWQDIIRSEASLTKSCHYKIIKNRK